MIKCMEIRSQKNRRHRLSLMDVLYYGIPAIICGAELTILLAAIIRLWN